MSGEDRLTCLLASEDVRDEVAFAINGAWNAQGDVPFPLYQHEAEALADAAMSRLRAIASQEGE